MIIPDSDGGPAGTVGLALSALPMLVRRIRELPTPSRSAIPHDKIIVITPPRWKDSLASRPAPKIHYSDEPGPAKASLVVMRLESRARTGT